MIKYTIEGITYHEHELQAKKHIAFMNDIEKVDSRGVKIPNYDAQTNPQSIDFAKTIRGTKIKIITEKKKEESALTKKEVKK